MVECTRPDFAEKTPIFSRELEGFGPHIPQGGAFDGERQGETSGALPSAHAVNGRLACLGASWQVAARFICEPFLAPTG